MINFIKKILPSKGFFCVAKALMYEEKLFFRHSFWDTHEEVYENALAQDKQGATVFIAQGSFIAPDNRKQYNVLHMRSFFVDIDCGEGKPYATQKDGVDALKKFCAETGLPLPAVINSGYGLYGYWPMAEDMHPDQWKGAAGVLKRLCNHYSFFTDHSRTSDTSSVLRPIGAFNKKRGGSKPVTLLRDIDPLNFDDFAEILRKAGKPMKISTELAAPKTSDLNSEFNAGIGGTPSDANMIADKCAQIRLMRDTKGDIPEPQWYACIGILKACLDGNAVIHEWSSGHPDYSPSETAAKIEQHRFPPTSCEHLGSLNSATCIGCTHNGKIKSPVALGRAVVPVEAGDSRCEIPESFTLTKDGIFFKGEDEPTRIYPYDIYPISIAWDESLGYETTTFRHKMPHSGWAEFSLKSSLVHEPRALLMALHDNHVQVVGLQEKKLMILFTEQYMSKLRDRQKMNKLCSQMGWKADGFVLGDMIFRKDEVPEVIGFSKNVPDAAKAFKQAGEVTEWVEATRLLGEPGMEAHAFTLLAGAFAAPLMRFTGYDGALVSCVGPSGTGKTLMARWAASAYGDSSKLLMLKDDTKNSLITRLGVYGSLPLAVDEVSNIDAGDLSDLVYRITQGRDKARLTKNAVERPNMNTWKTVAVVSSNHSLVDRLASLKSDASAEINRMFEYGIGKTETLNRANGKYIFDTITNNYGEVGKTYIRYLVDHNEELAANVGKVTDLIDGQTGARTEERFWSALVGAALYGGIIAQRLGLIKFDLAPVRKWVIETIKAQRTVKVDVTMDSVSLIGSFLDAHAGNTIVVSTNSKSTTGYKIPNGAIVVRYEMDTNHIFISREVFREWLRKRYANYNGLKKELQDMRPRSPLIAFDKRKSLTAGVVGQAGAPVHCWILDMNHPAMGGLMPEIVGGKEVTGKKGVAV